MNKIILSLTISSLLMAGILAISLQDAEAKVNAAPIKRIQVKAVDPLGEPVPDLTCEYVYDIIAPLKRIIITDDEGVINDKLDPKPSDNKITDFDCPGWLLIPDEDSPFVKFPIDIELSEKTLTKIKLTVEPSESLCPEDHFGYIFEGKVDTSALEGINQWDPMSTTVCVDPDPDELPEMPTVGQYQTDVLSASVGVVVIDPDCPILETFRVFNNDPPDSILILCESETSRLKINPGGTFNAFENDHLPEELVLEEFTTKPFEYTEGDLVVRGTITLIERIQ